MRRDWSELSGVDHRVGTVHHDHRGTFTKHVDETLETQFATTQVGTAFNDRAGTVRGMHFQAQPHGEVKRLWVSSGAVLDVLVDVRADSPSFGDWAAVELHADEPAVLTVPPGVAHGYQTLLDSTTVVYLITGLYVPESARTLDFQDPTVGIEWPLEVTALSEGDRTGRPWPVTS